MTKFVVRSEGLEELEFDTDTPEAAAFDFVKCQDFDDYIVTVETPEYFITYDVTFEAISEIDREQK
jgi:hypothetical protein